VKTKQLEQVISQMRQKLGGSKDDSQLLQAERDDLRKQVEHLKIENAKLAEQNAIYIQDNLKRYGYMAI
jgi:regulator of replication initiation timing